MADIARIGFVADTKDLKAAKTDLEALPPAAGKAEVAATRLSTRIKELGTTMSSKLGASIASARTALIGFASGMLASFGAQAIISGLFAISDRLDDVSKAASKLKVNVGDLQALGYAADLAGVGFDELATVANKMSKVIGTAIAKGKETQGVFKLLGISAKELSDLPIDERFGRIADKMNAMNLTADQTALILGQLGDRAGALAPLFEGGSKAINEASEQLDRFGGKISTPDDKNIEAMNDAFTSLQYSIQASGNQFVAFIASSSGITTLVNGIAELIGWLNRSKAAMASLGTQMLQLVPFLGPIINAVKGLSTLFQYVFGVSIATAAKAGANFVLNAFSAAYQSVGVIWDALPSLLGSAAIGAVNFVIRELNRLVSSSIAAINAIAGAIPDWMGGPQSGVDPNKWKVPEVKDPYANDTKAAFDAVSGIIDSTMKIDNFGGTAERTKDDVDPATKSVTDFGNALETAGNKAGTAAEKITELQKIGKELEAIGAPFDQAKSAFDKLRELQTNGIVTGDQYTAMLGRIQAAFIAAGGTATQWGKIIGQQTIDMTAALKEFSTNSLTSVGDAIADLAIEGRIDFKALADSIIRDMIRIMWQALVVKPIISAVFPGIGFADGGVFNSGGLTPFASGGVVSGPTLFQFADGGTTKNGLMGEAGPEAIMPLTRGNNGKLGVEAHGFNGKSGNVISIGDINIQQQSSGDSEKDRRHAAETGKQVRQELESLVVDIIQREKNYGGQLNPRGVRG